MLDSINANIKYVYILVIIVILVIIFLLLKELLKLAKTVAELQVPLTNINNNIEASKQKIEKVKASTDNFKLIFSVVTIFSLLSDMFKYRKQDNSLSKSFSKSCVKHASELKQIKL